MINLVMYKTTINKIYVRFRNSKLTKDSFWAIFGNGCGSVLVLLSGILIARNLGSDLYGEYGVVKSTMFTIGAFASCGLGITSTKYIAEAVANKSSQLKSLIYTCLFISFICSALLAIILLLCSHSLAIWLDSEQLTTPFRVLGIIIICRATNMTQRGILGGLKLYNKVARNAVLAGCIMLLSCIPLTIIFGLGGALTSLMLSEILNCIGNYISIRSYLKIDTCKIELQDLKEIILFSIPVALQEFTNFIGQWGGILLLTKLSSLEEVGIYSASAQWNAIIMFIPAVLYNVVISHLSSNFNNPSSQLVIMKKMLTVNLVSTLIPFIVIWLGADWIASLYGESFRGMGAILTVLTCSSIFLCCANVFRGQFVAYGKNWLLLFIRSLRDVLFLISAYFLIKYYNGIDGGLYYAWCNLITSILFCLILLLYTIRFIKSKSQYAN